MLDYKGCVGSVEFSEADGAYYGQIVGICTLVSYDGATIRELVGSFHDAVDDYLELCTVKSAAS